MFEDNNLLENRLNVIMDEDFFLINKLKEYLSKTNYSEENIKILIENAVTAVRYAAYSKEKFDLILSEELNIKLFKNELMNIDNIVNKYKNHIGVWIYNGYTISEYNNLLSKRSSLKKIGRNDSCPCGSGKKYKKCCGK